MLSHISKIYSLLSTADANNQAQQPQMGASLVDANSCSSLWLVGFPQNCQQTIPTSHFAGQLAAFCALCYAGSVLGAEGLCPPARPIVNVQGKSVVLPGGVSRMICASAG